MQRAMDALTTLLGFAVNLRTLPLAAITAAIVTSLIVGIWYSIDTFARMETLSDGGAPGGQTRKWMLKEFGGELFGNFIAAFATNLVAAVVLGVILGVVSLSGFLAGGAEGGVTVGFLLWLVSIVTTLGSGSITQGLSGKVAGLNLIFSLTSYLMLGLVVGLLL